jgi:hypothetical protein
MISMIPWLAFSIDQGSRLDAHAIENASQRLEWVSTEILRNKKLSTCFSKHHSGEYSSSVEMLSSISPILGSFITSLESLDTLSPLFDLISEGIPEFIILVLKFIEFLFMNIEWEKSFQFVKLGVPYLLKLGSLMDDTKYRSAASACLCIIVSRCMGIADGRISFSTLTKTRRYVDDGSSVTSFPATLPSSEVDSGVDRRSRTLAGDFARQRRLEYSDHLKKMTQAEGRSPIRIEELDIASSEVGTMSSGTRSKKSGTPKPVSPSDRRRKRHDSVRNDRKWDESPSRSNALYALSEPSVNNDKDEPSREYSRTSPRRGPSRQSERKRAVDPATEESKSSQKHPRETSASASTARARARSQSPMRHKIMMAEIKDGEPIPSSQSDLGLRSLLLSSISKKK